MMTCPNFTVSYATCPVVMVSMQHDSLATACFLTGAVRDCRRGLAGAKACVERVLLACMFSLAPSEVHGASLLLAGEA